MTRIKRGVTARFRHKKILRKVKGYYSARSRAYRVAYQAFIKANQYAYRDRKKRKQQFRKLWIIRINAATRRYGISYSKFMHNLKNLSIHINRKILSEIAFSEKKIFETLLKKIESS